ncbi:MAG: hypothetical protein KDA28_02115, partial [Phycisphaerales bacterium]|nr:hypothetical protein [Phycisphaerales bacterium]
MSAKIPVITTCTPMHNKAEPAMTTGSVRSSGRSPKSAARQRARTTPIASAPDPINVMPIRAHDS